MSSSLFCCQAIQPYRPQRLLHEDKFTAFVSWAGFPQESQIDGSIDSGIMSDKGYAIQLVKQVNFGPLETTRYFVPGSGAPVDFIEVNASALIQANFQKVNTYKNYKCSVHNKFFEINVYQRDPVNKHHWRANLARPATEIDL